MERKRRRRKEEEGSFGATLGIWIWGAPGVAPSSHRPSAPALSRGVLSENKQSPSFVLTLAAYESARKTRHSGRG